MRRRKKKNSCCLNTLIILVLFMVGGYFFAGRVIEYSDKILYPVKYSETVEYYAQKNGLEPELVFAVIREESRFNPDAVSSAGAAGLMQLQETTAKWAIQRMHDSNLEDGDFKNPETNIAIGCWYLRHLLDRFDGNTVKALAAYNSGPSNVDKWSQQSIWDGTLEDADNIPFWETRGFVRKVMVSYNKYREYYEENGIDSQSKQS